MMYLAMDVYGELADASRRKLLLQLRSGPKTVTQLVTETGMKQPNVSNHLARMRARGTVNATKIGRQVYYSISSPSLVEHVNASAVIQTSLDENLNVSEMALQLATSATRSEEQACAQILDRALSAGLPLLEVYEDLISEAMRTVGEWWERGVISVALEHIATEIILRQLDRIAGVLHTSPPIKGKVLLGTAAGSHHTVGLRILADYLRSQGWETVYLGANVPTDAFVKAVTDFEPSMVLISCTSEQGFENVDRLVKELRALSASQNFILGLGGRYTRENRPKFEAMSPDFIASSLREFAEIKILGPSAAHGLAQMR